MKAFVLNSGPRGRVAIAMRVGVSLAALLAAGAGSAAWAQAETQTVSPDTTQAATPGQEVGQPAADATGDGDIVITGRRAALEAADERKRRSEGEYERADVRHGCPHHSSPVTETVRR